jgi:hypothetical protein
VEAGRFDGRSGDDLVAGGPGEGHQVSFLPFAGLIAGRDPTVDGNLSQFNPLGNGAVKSQQNRAFGAATLTF